MKTLRDIVEPLVQELVNNGEQFSAHDVTTEVRKSVNTLAKNEQFDLPYADPSASHIYEVDHQEVKNIVNEMFRNGELGRVFNGTYFEYYGMNVQVQTAAPAPVNTGSGRDAELVDRVVQYLEGCFYPPRMNYVMGSAFRFNYVPLREVCDAIEKDSRVEWVDNTGSRSWWTVTLAK